MSDLDGFIIRTKLAMTSNKLLLPFYLLLFAVCLTAIWKNVTSVFWLDEVFTGAVACQDNFGATLALIRQDVHPAAYNLLIHLIFSLIGCHLWPVRLLSLVCSAAGAGILMRAIHRKGGNAVLATALIFGNPTFWEYAFEGRAYGILFFAGCGVVAYGLSDSPKDRLKAIAFALVGGLLHYYGAFLFVVLFALAIFAPQRSRYFWAAFFGAGALLCAYYIPQLATSFGVSAQLTWIPHPTLHLFVFDFLGSLFGSVASAAIIGALYIVAAERPSMQTRILLGVFCGITLLLFCTSYFRPTFVYRYMHLLVPALIMGVAMTVKTAKPGLARTSYYFLLLYLGCNLVHLLPVPFANKQTIWRHAIDSMDCTSEKPCAFVLDSAPLTPAQNAAIANFMAKEPGSFTAVPPEGLTAWVAGHPDTQFLYMQCTTYKLDMKQMIDTFSLTCSRPIGEYICQTPK